MKNLKQLIDSISRLVFNKSFLLGVGICFAMFSKYILGPDNLMEQIGEKFVRDYLGIDIDFSPERYDSENNNSEAK